MTTLLAPNLIAPLQRHARVTLSTQIRDDRTVRGRCEALGSGSGEGVLRA